MPLCPTVVPRVDSAGIGGAPTAGIAVIPDDMGGGPAGGSSTTCDSGTLSGIAGGGASGRRAVSAASFVAADMDGTTSSSVFTSLNPRSPVVGCSVPLLHIPFSINSIDAFVLLTVGCVRVNLYVVVLPAVVDKMPVHSPSAAHALFADSVSMYSVLFVRISREINTDCGFFHEQIGSNVSFEARHHT